MNGMFNKAYLKLNILISTINNSFKLLEAELGVCFSQ